MTNKDGFVETALLNQPKEMTNSHQIKLFKYQSAYNKIDDSQKHGENGEVADEITMNTF